MAFRVDAVRIEIDGNNEFAGDVNPYTPNGITIKFTIPSDDPLVRELLDRHREQILAELKAMPPTDVFG